MKHCYNSEIEIYKTMDSNIAIKVSGVSKTFRIPHEKVSSLRGAAVNAFKGNKGYEEFKALDDVSFEVKKGEFFGIIGRNGSGKSTLLKILAGIYQADRGSVKIDGRISPFLELGIGFNPELSGRDNVYLNATVLGLTKKEIDEKFDSIVAFSELERFIDQKLKNYSSGMQVRLAFSVSIHANREILLMDEVLAVGDSNFQSKCLNEFKKYREAGKTVILVSHDISTIKSYCDRALLLRDGKISHTGKADEVATKYLYENIHDEERKNLLASKSKKNGKSEVDDFSRFKSGKAEILDYTILNHENNETTTLKSDEDFTVKFTIKLNIDVKNPVFSLLFTTNSKENLFGMHSLYSNKPLELNFLKKDSVVEIVIKNKMLLNEGFYDMSLSCGSQESLVEYEIFDSMKDVEKINVYNEKKIWGIINSNPIISIENRD